MDSVTVIDGCTLGYSETEIHSYTTIGLWKGRMTQPVSSLLSVCFVFCVVHELKQTVPLKSGILVLANVHQR
jgi:hypothetical protein